MALKGSIKWDTRPKQATRACLSIRGEGGAQHAIEHTKHHLGYVSHFLLVALLDPCFTELSSCSSLRRVLQLVPTIGSSLLRALQCMSWRMVSTFECGIPNCLRCSAVSSNMPPLLPKISKCCCTSAYPEVLRCSKRLLCCSCFSLKSSAYASSVQQPISMTCILHLLLQLKVLQIFKCQ